MMGPSVSPLTPTGTDITRLKFCGTNNGTNKSRWYTMPSTLITLALKASVADFLPSEL